MKNLFIISSISTLLLVCCDCYVHQTGRVISNVDGQPIINARIDLQNTNTYALSDSMGYFNIEYSGGGNCPEPIYTISKEGYKNFEIAFEYSNSESIIIVKKGNKNYDLNGKYFYPDSTNPETFLTFIQFDKYSKDYAIKNDSLFIYMDLDDNEIEFENYLKNSNSYGWNTDKYKIK